MKETVETIIRWHANTFPQATLVGQLEKFYEERIEYEEAKRPHKLEELADMYIVACGICRFDAYLGAEAMAEMDSLFAHHDKRNIKKAIDKKMAINRQRQWGCKNGYYKHLKPGEAAGCGGGAGGAYQDKMCMTAGHSYIVPLPYEDEPLWVRIAQGVIVCLVFALMFVCALTIIGSLS